MAKSFEGEPTRIEFKLFGDLQELLVPFSPQELDILKRLDELTSDFDVGNSGWWRELGSTIHIPKNRGLLDRARVFELLTLHRKRISDALSCPDQTEIRRYKDVLNEMNELFSLLFEEG